MVRGKSLSTFSLVSLPDVYKQDQYPTIHESHQVGAEQYRLMRARGETPLPAAVHLESAENFTIPSRDTSISIPCRILRPQNTAPKGVYMHIHGGGWVLQNESSQDPYLQAIANMTSTLVISIGYRLAPEHPFPAAPNDCYDAAEWLVQNAPSTFNASLSFIGGESAGGHLSALTIIHLLQHQSPTFNEFRFKGALLHFGVFDVSGTPSTHLFRKPQCLVLDKDLMDHYSEVFLPGVPREEWRHPSISPLYADLESLRGKLPPALFTCGTEDPLLDDTVFMSAKWQMAGAETDVKIFPGAPHGYIGYPRGTKGSMSDEGLDAVESFIASTLA